MPTNADPSLDSQEDAAPQGPQFPALSQHLARGNARNVLQAAGAQDREYLAYQRLGLEAQTLELHKVHELGQIQQAQMRVQDGMEKQRQTMQAVKALSAISHDDPDFEVKIAQITHDNPAGMGGPIIDGRIKFLRETAQRQLAAREALNIHAQEVGLKYAAKLGVDPLFKTDAKGLMTPDITGMETAAKAKREAASKGVTDSGLVQNGAEVNAAGDTIQKFGPKKDDVPLAIRTKYAESKALVASHSKALKDHETAIKAEEKQNTDAGKAGVGYSKAKEYNDLKVKHDANEAFVGSLEETYPELKAEATSTTPAKPAKDTASVPSKVPKAGDIVQGYKFKGGNPAEPTSWEALN